MATKKSQDEWRTLSVEERIRYGVQAINGVQGVGSDRMLFRQNNRPNNYAEYSAEQYSAEILIVRS